MLFHEFSSGIVEPSVKISVSCGVCNSVVSRNKLFTRSGASLASFFETSSFLNGKDWLFHGAMSL